MSDQRKLKMIKLGIMLGKANTCINIDTVSTMEDFAEKINAEFEADLKPGVSWDNLFDELEKAIQEKSYNTAMAIVK